MDVFVYWNRPICPCIRPSIRVSVCVQNASFCQNADRGVKSHSVTALVVDIITLFLQSLVGLKHNSDSNRTWHQLISSLQDLQFLQKISFDEVPASVLHSLCSRLTQLEVFCADQITEIGSDSSK